MDDVNVNAMTASVLIIHRDAFSPVADFAARQGLFRLESLAPSAPSLSRELSERAGSVDRILRRQSAGGLDLGALTFFLLLGLSIFQLSRGNVLAPAVTLLWYAMNALSMRSADQGQTNDESRQQPKRVRKRAAPSRRGEDTPSGE